MNDQTNTIAPISLEDLERRGEAAKATFLTGVARWLALDEVIRARQAGEEPSEARLQARLLQMTERVKEVQP